MHQEPVWTSKTFRGYIPSIFPYSGYTKILNLLPMYVHEGRGEGRKGKMEEMDGREVRETKRGKEGEI
jgi:hypothetical protein